MCPLVSPWTWTNPIKLLQTLTLFLWMSTKATLPAYSKLPETILLYIFFISFIRALLETRRVRTLTTHAHIPDCTFSATFKFFHLNFHCYIALIKRICLMFCLNGLQCILFIILSVRRKGLWGNHDIERNGLRKLYREGKTDVQVQYKRWVKMLFGSNHVIISMVH
jgi:hypothetical protein